MQYFVYVIGKTEELSDINKCYVGVTNNLKQRWYFHTRSKYRVGCFIRKHNLCYEENMKVIFMGEEHECFAKESELRPEPNTGLNEAAGGQGGFTSYTEQRNKKISDKMKTRKITWRDKISATIRESGDRKGSKNNRAKKWVLKSPEGKEFFLHGNVSATCESLNLSAGVLRIHMNNIVPAPNIGSNYGGYRILSADSHNRRLNTTGWCLMEV